MTWDGLALHGYRSIVADPPWPIVWPKAHAGGKRSNVTYLGYATMPLGAIMRLPVHELAHTDGAHLYLWVTPQLNREGVGVETCEAWGFQVVDELVWHKPNFGMGAFPRHCHELLLIARCGNARTLETCPRDVRSVQTWRQLMAHGKVHSAKPAAALDLVETATPGPYVELFARRQRLGWHTWGNGYEEAAAH